MTDKENRSSNFEDLRSKAKDLLKKREVDLSSYPTEVSELIEDLRVHQAELEVQKDELKSTQQKISKLHQEYETLYEFAPCGYITLDSKGIITLCNLTGVALLGAERGSLKSLAFSRFVAQSSQNDYLSALKQAGQSGEQQTTELELARQDGEGVWMQADIQPEQNEEGSIEQWRITLTDISDRKEAEERLQKAHNKLDTLVQLNAEGLMVLDREGKILFTNPATEKMLRREQEELLGEEFGYLLTPNVSTEIELLSEAGETNVVELRARETEWSGQSALLATFRDITERKRAEEELEAIYENAPLIMLLLDSEQRVRKANKYSTDFIGVSEESMYGQRVGDILRCTQLDSPSGCGSGPQCEQCTLLNTVSETFRTGQSFNQVETTATLIREDKEWNFTFLISSTLLQHQGEPMVLYALMDITLRKEAEEGLRRLSFSDTLTGLYNRNFFEEEMNRLSDGRHSPIGIIIFDVDDLKYINDNLGHESGDHILITVAGILQENLRDSDIIARIGGDEFAVLLPEIDQAGIQSILERVRSSVEQFNSTQGQIPLSVSMGQTVSEPGETDMPALLKEADNRMYGEKMQRRESAHR